MNVHQLFPQGRAKGKLQMASIHGHKAEDASEEPGNIFVFSIYQEGVTGCHVSESCGRQAEFYDKQVHEQSASRQDSVNVETWSGILPLGQSWRSTMYLSHLGGIRTFPWQSLFSSINQLNHPELVPFDLNLVPIRLRGLLAHTVIACSDSKPLFALSRIE
jgi:hypothetical protein